MIPFGNHKISDIVITSYGGHSGGFDMFPLNLMLSYHEIADLVREHEITSIAKSTTRFNRKGFFRPWAPWMTIRKIKDPDDKVIGLINAFGLRNSGVEKCAKMNKEAIKKGFRVIPSYFPEFSKGIATALLEMHQAVLIYKKKLGQYFWVIEINASCTNSGESLEQNEENVITGARFLRKIFNGCIIFKLSPVHSLELALELESIGINIIHGVNTFPHRIIFPDPKDKSPLEKYGGGGYSGEFMAGKSFKKNSEFRKALHIPMIMGCGISSRDHMRHYKDMAKSVSFASYNSFAICSVLRTNHAEAKRVICC